ncbi:hypothetical protein FSP39_023085 [Pinctada imbricata]|uniref:G-protein coupled receptors family 1 profile domain-containing protein n=1 Tax=Pinctada imbricata TaxID=66713 RepID=A0AA89BRY0_PINIB|nr:hypothetical protein FSP39_023085 [Pinctada imbricata]
MANFTTNGSYMDKTTYSYLTTESANTYSVGYHEEITIKPFEELKDRTYFGLGILCLILIPLLCGGNLLVLLSLFIFRKLRSIQNLLIGCLASFDLLLSITCLPTYVVYYWFSDILVKYKYLCIFKYATIIGTGTGSLLSLLAIAVDRYIAVMFPLKYAIKMTMRKARKIIIVVWAYTVTIGIIPFFWHNGERNIGKCDFTELLPLYYFLWTVFIFIPAAIISSTALYLKIYIVAIRQKKKMLQRRSRDTASRRQFEKSTKSAFVMAIVLFFFVAFWLPFMVCVNLKILGLEENIFEAIKSIALTLTQINSGINPVIYCFGKTDFRIAFRLMFEILRGKRQLNRDACLSEKKDKDVNRITCISITDNVEMNER